MAKQVQWDKGRDQKRIGSHWMRLHCEHMFINFNLPEREWAKLVSKPLNGACERSKRRKQINVATDQVAHFKGRGRF